MSIHHSGLKGGEEVSDRARGQCAHEVARAGPDAEAEEQVKLIGGEDSGALAAGEEEAETVKEGGGACKGGTHRGGDEGVGAKRSAKDRVAGGYGRALTTEEGGRALTGGAGGIAKGIGDTAEGSCGGLTEGRLGEEWAVDGGLARRRDKASRAEAGRGRRQHPSGGRWVGLSNKARDNLGDDGRRCKDVNVIGVCDHDAAMTDEGGKGTEDRVETEGEELSAEWVALPRAARRHNDLRRQAIASHIELRRSSIPCDGPSPESREARCND